MIGNRQRLSSEKNPSKVSLNCKLWIPIGGYLRQSEKFSAF